MQLLRTPGGDGEPAGFSSQGIDRASPLGWYAVVVVALVARLRGLLALVGQGISGLVIARFMLPALLTGEPGVAVVLVTGSAIMYTVLYLAHGISIRTSTALAGTLGGIAMTAALAEGAVRASHLNGVSDETGQLLPPVIADSTMSKPEPRPPGKRQTPPPTHQRQRRIARKTYNTTPLS